MSAGLIRELLEEAVEYERLSKVEKSDFATKFAYTEMAGVTNEHADELAKAVERIRALEHETMIDGPFHTQLTVHRPDCVLCQVLAILDGREGGDDH